MSISSIPGTGGQLTVVNGSVGPISSGTSVGALAALQQIPVASRIMVLNVGNENRSLVVTVSREFPRTAATVATFAGSLGSCARMFGFSRLSNLLNSAAVIATLTALATNHLRDQQDLNLARGVAATVINHLQQERLQQEEGTQRLLNRTDSEETVFTQVVEEN